jgi:hypothetical protein
MKVKLLLVIAFVCILAVPFFSASVQAANCLQAGGTGLTASVVAQPGQMITGIVDAAGCDLGIYVGPGMNGVTIANATVTDANHHGILVQDAANVVIEDSLITGNGLTPNGCAFGTGPNATNPCIVNDYEVLLAGTSHSIVKGNTVSFNSADGGIALTDDGPINPGAPKPGTAHQSVANVVTHNLIENNLVGCGINVALYNSGGSAVGNVVTWNLVVGDPPGTGPYDGQIVIATNGPGETISDTFVYGNIIDGSSLPGIAVHANAPGDVISGTVMQSNIINDNGYYPPDFASPNTPVAANGTVGISLVAEASPGMTSPPTVTGTSIISNDITNNKYGIWTCNVAEPVISQLRGNATTPVIDCHSGIPMATSTTPASTTTTTQYSVAPTIPGFTLEAILLGLLVGVSSLVFARRRLGKTRT